MGDEFEFNPWYGNFPYTDFIKQEGIPIHEAYAVDCHTVQVEPWERMGGLGAYVHLAGRSDVPVVSTSSRSRPSASSTRSSTCTTS